MVQYFALLGASACYSVLFRASRYFVLLGTILLYFVLFRASHYFVLLCATSLCFVLLQSVSRYFVLFWAFRAVLCYFALFRALSLSLSRCFVVFRTILRYFALLMEFQVVTFQEGQFDTGTARRGCSWRQGPQPPGSRCHWQVLSGTNSPVLAWGGRPHCKLSWFGTETNFYNVSNSLVSPNPWKRRYLQCVLQFFHAGQLRHIYKKSFKHIVFLQRFYNVFRRKHRNLHIFRHKVGPKHWFLQCFQGSGIKKHSIPWSPQTIPVPISPT